MGGARSGGCQCGRVRFRASALKENSHVCHCRMCQKATGNFFAALVGVPYTDFSWRADSRLSFKARKRPGAASAVTAAHRFTIVMNIASTFP